MRRVTFALALIALLAAGITGATQSGADIVADVRAAIEKLKAEKAAKKKKSED